MSTSTRQKPVFLIYQNNLNEFHSSSQTESWLLAHLSSFLPSPSFTGRVLYRVCFSPSFSPSSLYCVFLLPFKGSQTPCPPHAAPQGSAPGLAQPLPPPLVFLVQGRQVRAEGHRQGENRSGRPWPGFGSLELQQSYCRQG